MTGRDKADLAADAVRTADASLRSAIERFNRRDVLARALLQEAETAFQTAGQCVDGALRATGVDRQALAAQAIEAAKDTLQKVDEMYAKCGIGDKKDEWKECRSTIDRFDKILVDLRKTGFGFVTALVGAAAFLFMMIIYGVFAAGFASIASARWPETKRFVKTWWSLALFAVVGGLFALWWFNWINLVEVIAGLAVAIAIIKWRTGDQAPHLLDAVIITVIYLTIVAAALVIGLP